MLYLGIDQHARQITISLRNDSGDVLLARQVSTKPEKINAFFEQLTRERAQLGNSAATQHMDDLIDEGIVEKCRVKKHTRTEEGFRLIRGAGSGGPAGPDQQSSM